MASLKTKKRLMYTVFAFIFLCGGIEYAVILPTLWLYLHNEYGVHEYMLGIVLSAYSLSAALSSPLVGRISDRTRKTKLIFIVCTLIELGGSVLYFADISVWMCVCSRFISGLGAGSEATVFAEVARYTTEKERTGILSKLAAIRQIALLMGPGFNVFLREADFTLGPFKVNKYTSPGGFLVGIWFFLLLLILFLYYEPAQVYTQEMEESRATAVEDVEKIKQGRSHSVCSRDDANLLSHKEISTDQKPPQYTSISTVAPTHSHHPESDREKEISARASQEGDADNIESVVGDVGTGDDQNHRDSHQCQKSREEQQRSDTGLPAEEGHDLQKSSSHEQGVQIQNGFIKTEKSPEDPALIEFPETSALGTSFDLMVSAENFISNSVMNASSSDLKPGLAGEDGEKVSEDSGRGEEEEEEERGGIELRFEEHHFGDEDDVEDGVNEPCDSCVGYDDVFSGPRSASAQEKRKREDCPVCAGRKTGNKKNRSYIQQSSQVLDDPIVREGKLGFFCNEYMRDEVVAIVYVIFCTMFSQVCVETMVTPLSLKYLDFGELENSLMYCACGVEIIVVMFMVNALSERLSDFTMVCFGCVMLFFSSLLLFVYLPFYINPYDRAGNLLFFSIPVFLDVLSLPFLFVCSTSLFSKLTRKQTQGLSQGLRRAVVGLGTILGPLWGAGTVDQPHLLYGVLVALQGLALLLLLGSCRKLKGWQQASKDPEDPNPSTGTESQRLLGSERVSSSSQQSQQYGSIQKRPLAGDASYQSLSTAALENRSQESSTPTV